MVVPWGPDRRIISSARVELPVGRGATDGCFGRGVSPWPEGTSLAGGAGAHQRRFAPALFLARRTETVMKPDNDLGIVFANKCKKQNGVANLVGWSILIIRMDHGQ